MLLLSLILFFFLAESFSTFFFLKSQFEVSILTAVKSYLAYHRLVSTFEKLKTNLIFERKRNIACSVPDFLSEIHATVRNICLYFSSRITCTSNFSFDNSNYYVQLKCCHRDSLFILRILYCDPEKFHMQQMFLI